ncbi:MAG: hydrogenase 4 subunit B [Proteobacteria bacterium]|nr:hydrogenase 4 subunit B [Pseudomonadota bacterium]MBI3496417.1 hydrogenase 4 subunit B [Pseudomonadota bacterium]
MLSLVLLGVALLLLLGALAPFVGGEAAARRIVYGASLAISAVLAVLAIARLLEGGPPASAVLPIGLPWLDAHFRLDELSAYFLVVVNLVAAIVSIFAFGYASHDVEPARVTPPYPVFLAGCNLVLIADDAFMFLLSWEFMSLSSWLLVMANHRQPETRRAAFVYLVMAAFGTLMLLFAFGVLAGPAGDYDFDSMREAKVKPLLASAAFVLVLLGTGSKAGLVPLHVWLPLAHPAAPSHVSALMSGVMTKVALYGMIRVLFDLLGEPAWWWGGLVLLLGAVSAVIGVLYALLQRDLKVMLAYSTVENVGIIVLGIGLALAFKASRLPDLAALALVAALLHVMNHALFKSLLFCGAGAVLVATGQRDLEKLGGLIRRMPLTALFFLVGCLALSGLPPLNGFVSEWLTFQAIFSSTAFSNELLRLGVPVAGALLALSAALAAACFIKAFGIAFLGRPRGAAAAAALEPEGAMTAALALFSFACLVLGAFPGFAILIADPVARTLLGDGLPVNVGGFLWLTPFPDGATSYSGLIVLVLVLSVPLSIVWLVQRLGVRQQRRSHLWDCGFPDPSPATQYTASSFSQPIRRVFGTVLFRARESVDMPPPGDMRPARFAVTLVDPAWDWLFQPIGRIVGYVTQRINILQFMTIRRYLSLMFTALVILLLVVVVNQ